MKQSRRHPIFTLSVNATKQTKRRRHTNSNIHSQPNICIYSLHRLARTR